MKLIKAGITAAKGFLSAGVHCGIKFRNKDLALIYSQAPCAACAVFTQNKVQAAPLKVTRAHLRNNRAQAVVINSGNANCSTGKTGLADARNTCSEVARQLGVKQGDVLVASTGIIGKRLPLFKIKQAIPGLCSALDRNSGLEAARAIMTTDRHPKQMAVELNLAGAKVTIGAMAKGAGMIHPNMATMLSFICTDALIEPLVLKQALKQAADNSFNLVTVDGDTSTNDMVIALANGLAGNSKMQQKDLQLFQRALDFVCLNLAKMIVRDAEGATKFIEVRVEGANNFAQAKKIAFGVARSPLVKTAIFGSNPNWGRIAAACGAAERGVNADKLGIYLGRVKVMDKGAASKINAQALKSAFQDKQVLIRISLGLGEASTRVFTCDLSDRYIKINARY